MTLGPQNRFPCSTGQKTASRAKWRKPGGSGLRKVGNAGNLVRILRKMSPFGKVALCPPTDLCNKACDSDEEQ